MSDIPSDLRYMSSHEWVRVDADGTAYVGITDDAQNAMGDLVYVELPEVGDTLAAGDEVGVVESVKVERVAAQDRFHVLDKGGLSYAIRAKHCDEVRIGQAEGRYPAREAKRQPPLPRRAPRRRLGPIGRNSCGPRQTGKRLRFGQTAEVT